MLESWNAELQEMWHITGTTNVALSDMPSMTDKYYEEFKLYEQLQRTLQQQPAEVQHKVLGLLLKRIIYMIRDDAKKRTLRAQSTAVKLQLLQDLNWCLMHQRLYPS